MKRNRQPVFIHKEEDEGKRIKHYDEYSSLFDRLSSSLAEIDDISETVGDMLESLGIKR